MFSVFGAIADLKHRLIAMETARDDPNTGSPGTEAPKVFISYSRRDIAFVDRLQTALDARGIEVFVDRDDIEKGESWWLRIQQLILASDTIIFVLSRDSASSSICQQEVDFAESLNKRFVPIVARDLEDQPAPAALARLNYIFFVGNAIYGTSCDFNAAIDQVVRVLETDIGWIREHTRLGTLAERWKALQRRHELLLRGNELAAAETWLTTRPKQAPEPTDTHRNFITESRRAATARQRMMAGISIAVAAIAIILSSFALWQWRVAVQRADETEAAFIWSRLDFEQEEDPRTRASVQSLWDLAKAPEGVRDAFLTQIARDRSQVDRLTTAPASISRALGLRPHRAEVRRLMMPVVDTIRVTTDHIQLQALALAVQTLGPKLAPEQIQTALGQVLDTIRHTTDPPTLWALAKALQSLGPTPAQAQAALGEIVNAIRQTTDYNQLQALARAVQTLGTKLAPEHAQAVLRLVLDAIHQTTEPNQSQVLAQAVQIFGPTSDQALVALDPTLNALPKSSSFNESQPLAEVVKTLGPKLTPEQAQKALGPILDAIQNTKNPDHLSALALVIQTLGPTPEQAELALGPVLSAVYQSAQNPYQYETLAQAVQSLGSKLAPRQAQRILTWIHLSIASTEDPFKLQALAEIVQGLGSKLAPKQALSTLEAILHAISQTTAPQTLQALALAAQTLGSTPEQARAALDPILGAIHQTTDPSTLSLLIPALKAFGPTPEQTQAALSPVLDAIRHITDYNYQFLAPELARAVQVLGPTSDELDAALGLLLDAILETSDPDQLQALAQAIQTLGPTPEQAEAALGPVFDAIRHTTDNNQLQSLAQAAQSLGPILAAEQAQTAAGPILHALTRTNDPNQLQVLAQLVQTLASKLTPKQVDAASEISRTVLATTADPLVAEAFARAIAVSLQLDPAKPQPYVAAIVELLKWPTTAAEWGATNALLEVLHDRVPGAPGKEAGLDATVRWVAATFPEIDLDSPPTPPASVGTGAAW